MNNMKRYSIENNYSINNNNSKKPATLVSTYRNNQNDYRRLQVICPFNANRFDILKAFNKFGKIEDIQIKKNTINNGKFTLQSN